MRIAIVSNITNGIGLQVDYELLRDFLVANGHQVDGLHYLSAPPALKTYDVAIFLETVPREFMGIAHKMFLIPNPEWLRPEAERLVRRHFDKILCKTRIAASVLSQKFPNVHYVGFLTRDRLDASIERKRAFLHVGGNGGYRNTQQVLSAWREYRYWAGIPAEDAPLTIISNSTAYKHENTPGVTYHKRVSDEDLHKLQNECMFHLYPSQYEGWGHAARESQSVGALLLTTDAAPMNELKVSYKIPTCGSTTHLNATLHEVSPGDIREAVDAVLSGNEATLGILNGEARFEFEQTNASFKDRLLPHIKAGLKEKAVVAILGNHRHEWCTERDIGWSFESLGHKVIRFQEDQDTTEEILETCQKEDVKLLLYISTHGWITPGELTMDQVLDECKARSIITVGFHLDRYWGLNLSDGREDRVGQAAWWKCDFVFTADGGNQGRFRERDVNHVWMPPAVVKRDCHPGTPQEDLKVDVGFVGARGYHPEYPYRADLIKFLEEIYGDKFRIFNGYRGEALNNLYASIKVVVGDSCFGGSDYYWSDRVPETLGRGGFLIHPECRGLRIPGLATYEPGNLIDLADRIDWFLGHEDERMESIRLASVWVKENETYTNRCQEILKKVGL